MVCFLVWVKNPWYGAWGMILHSIVIQVDTDATFPFLIFKINPAHAKDTKSIRIMIFLPKSVLPWLFVQNRFFHYRFFQHRFFHDRFFPHSVLPWPFLFNLFSQDDFLQIGFAKKSQARYPTTVFVHCLLSFMFVCRLWRHSRLRHDGRSGFHVGPQRWSRDDWGNSLRF